MGKRSRERRTWKTTPDGHAENRMVRVWICLDCRKQGVTLINCADGAKRCATCTAGFARLPERSIVVQP